jgi:hypothetical protein
MNSFQKRLVFVTNPSWESGFNESFYRLGRPLFSFVVRWMSGGADLLLQMKLLNKLAVVGNL